MQQGKSMTTPSWLAAATSSPASASLTPGAPPQGARGEPELRGEQSARLDGGAGGGRPWRWALRSPTVA